MQYFTTLFDKNYLSRGLVLIESIKSNSTDFKIFLLSLDSLVSEYFRENSELFPEVTIINLADIEQNDLELNDAKKNRSLIEYYFTLSPCLPLYIIEKFNLPHICSLDADIKFFDTPKRIFDYLNDYSIIITPHKFSDENKHNIKHGIFNVSFQIFKNDDIGLNCLKNWKNQCINWCKDELDIKNNRYADQKYLDTWPGKYLKNVKILDDKICGLAPWNINNYSIYFNKNSFYSGNERIVFFHFHHNKFLNKYWATNGFYINHVKTYKGVNKIYANYWNDIVKFEKTIKIKSNIDIRKSKSYSNLVLKLLNEKSVFLKLNKSIFLFIDFNLLPTIIKKIIKKIYAENNYD